MSCSYFLLDRKEEAFLPQYHSARRSDQSSRNLDRYTWVPKKLPTKVGGMQCVRDCCAAPDLQPWRSSEPFATVRVTEPQNLIVYYGFVQCHRHEKHHGQCSKGWTSAHARIRSKLLPTHLKTLHLTGNAIERGQPKQRETPHPILPSLKTENSRNTSIPIAAALTLVNK